MEAVYTIAGLRAARAGLPEPVGLVPTMGYLHAGHLSLAQRARVECASVVASIFVNPTQFSPSEDLADYPRDLERDLAHLEAAGVDLVFLPEVIEIYPPGFETYVLVEKLSQPLEGARRPGHFKGVATVVAKLFNLVQPQRAYFGQKDAQQVRVIQQMVGDLNFPLEVVVCATVREVDGLAMSSRNSYLTPAQRAAAPVLHRSLRAMAEAYQSGERDAQRLRQLALELLAAEPMALVEYVSITDAQTLTDVARVDGPVLVSMAVRIGRARLIDNLLLGV